MASYRTDLMEESKCPICSCVVSGEMENHLASHAPVSPIQEVPSDHTPDIPDRTQHLCCPICPTPITGLKAQFARHMKLHTTVTCSLCASTVNFNWHGSHMSTCRHTHGGTTICPICQEQLPSRKAGRHFKEHVTEFECPYPRCSTLITFYTFKPHMGIHYNQLTGSHDPLPTQNVPIRSGSNPSPIQISNHPTTPSPVLLQCKFCDQTITDKDQVVRSHIYSHILHTCPICQTRYINESHFDSHIKTCLKQQPNPFSCPVCVRRYAIEDSILQHLHAKHCSALVACQGCRKHILCISLNSHPIKCLKKNMFSTLAGNQQHIQTLETVECAVCKEKIMKDQLSSHFVAHFLYKCLFCGCVSRDLDEIINNITVCIPRWIGTQLAPMNFTCPFCSVKVSHTTFSHHLLEDHILFCPLCCTVIAKKMLSHHGLACTANNSDIVSAFQCDQQFQATATDASYILDTNCKLSPNNFESTNSEFVCPFCEETTQTGNIDMISSHLLSCINVPPDMEVVTLPNLVGFRIN